MTARAQFDELDHAWQRALEEAWTSWCGGSAGVGAVITDHEGEIVAVGRNRMIDERDAPGVLASTSIAHAEMNALAALRLGPTDGLTITSTYEPCLMCATTILQARIPRVRYASIDPLFEGLHDWFADLEFARARIPERTELGGPIGAFAHVLHVSWLSFWVSDPTVVDAHDRLRPRHLAVARAVTEDNRLAAVASDGGDVVDAIDALWPDLVDLASSP